jgi:hypothetical protein
MIHAKSISMDPKVIHCRGDHDGEFGAGTIRSTAAGICTGRAASWRYGNDAETLSQISEVVLFRLTI